MLPNSSAPAAPLPVEASTGDAPPLACDLMALDEADRETHPVQAVELLGRDALERQELPDGYAFRFPADAYPRVAAFVDLERRCCAFFHFVLDVPPAGGPLWLRITGSAEVKALLAADIAQLLA